MRFAADHGRDHRLIDKRGVSGLFSRGLELHAVRPEQSWTGNQPPRASVVSQILARDGSYFVYAFSGGFFELRAQHNDAVTAAHQWG